MFSLLLQVVFPSTQGRWFKSFPRTRSMPSRPPMLGAFHFFLFIHVEGNEILWPCAIRPSLDRFRSPVTHKYSARNLFTIKIACVGQDRGVEGASRQHANLYPYSATRGRALLVVCPAENVLNGTMHAITRSSLIIRVAYDESSSFCWQRRNGAKTRSSGKGQSHHLR